MKARALSGRKRALMPKKVKIRAKNVEGMVR